MHLMQKNMMLWYTALQIQEEICPDCITAHKQNNPQ